MDTIEQPGPCQSRRNLRICTAEGILATPFVFIAIPGNFIMAALVTQVFGIEKAVYGLIVSMPAWFNALQLFIIPWLNRFMSVRSLNLGFAWAQVAMWALLTAALPFIPRDDAQSAARILFFLLALSSLVGSVTGVGWTSWIQEWIPARIRGKYFGRRNRLVGLATIVFLLLVGKLVETLGASIETYVILFATATILRAGSVWLQYGIRVPRPEGATAIHVRWTEQIVAVTRNRAFLHFVGFSAFVAFWMNFVGPFVPIFMFDHLDLDLGIVTRFVIIASLTSALALPLWGQLLDRYGCKVVIVLSIVLWEVHNYLYIILTPALSWMLYPMWFWGGMVSGGFWLGSFTMLLKLLGRETKTTGISFNLAVSSVAAALAPICAGALLGSVSDAGSQLLAYRIVFGVKSTAVLLALFWLARVVEPRSVALRSVFGSMRTMRQTLLVDGLAFFANVTMVRSSKRRRGSTELRTVRPEEEDG